MLAEARANVNRPPDPARPAPVWLSLRGVTRTLAVAITVQSLLGFGIIYVVYIAGYASFSEIARLFNLDVENSLSSLYQTAQLGLCAVTLACIAGSGRRMSGAPHERCYWWLLAAAFAYLALDEGAAIHELTSRPVRAFLGLGGIFYWAWVIPAGLACGVFGLVFLRFLRALPSRTRAMFIIAGVIYIGAAVGLEIIGEAIAGSAAKDAARASYGDFFRALDHRTWYLLAAVAEETLEPIGILIFLRALLELVAEQLPRIDVRVVP